jgi:hypothetical protein
MREGRMKEEEDEEEEFNVEGRSNEGQMAILKREKTKI